MFSFFCGVDKLRLTDIVLGAALTFGPCESGIDDGYIGLSEIYNYQYGVVDANNNKRIDEDDLFFVHVGYEPKPKEWGVGYEYKALATCFHKIYCYSVNEDGTINFELDEYSSEVWYDYNFDGQVDYVTDERIHNLDLLNKIFKPLTVPQTEGSVKIERKK